jgi:WD40 repeat protein
MNLNWVSRAARGLALLCATLTVVAQPAPDIPVRALVAGVPIGSGEVEDLSYSPDGRLLAVSTTVGFEVLESGTGRLVNTVTRPATAFLSQRRWSTSWTSMLCWSPDGKRIARAAGGIEIWDPLGKAPERTLPATDEEEAFEDLAWSPTGNQIAAQSGHGIVLLDVASGRRSLIPERSNEDQGLYLSVAGFSWAPDGRQIAVVVVTFGSRPEVSIDIWDAQRLTLVRKIPVRDTTRADGGGGGGAGAQVVVVSPPEPKVVWSPDGQVLALTGGLNWLSLWDAHTGKLLRSPRQVNEVISLSWSRDSRLLCVGTPQQVRFIRRADGAPEYVLENDSTEEPMRSTAVSADGKHLASFLASFSDAEIDLWRGREDAPCARIPWDGDVRSSRQPTPAASPDGRRIAVFLKGKLAIRESASGRQLVELPGADRVSWSPDGKVIVARRALRQVDLFRAGDGRPIASFQAQNLVWSPNGDLVADASHDVIVLSVADGNVVASVKAPPQPGNPGAGYFHASWSPNGRRILLQDFGEPPQYLEPAVFSLDDKTLSPPPPGEGRLFWVGPEELVRSSIPRDCNVVQSPDLRYAAALSSSGGNANWRFWDLRAGQVLAGGGSEGPQNTGRTVVWSPDSKRVAYLTGTNEVHVWDVAGGRLVERWNAPGSGILQDLVWRDKLTVLDVLVGAVRVWREP